MQKDPLKQSKVGVRSPRRQRRKPVASKTNRYGSDETPNRLTTLKARKRRDNWKVSRNQLQTMDVSDLREYMDAKESAW